jgi:hypothetical protein
MSAPDPQAPAKAASVGGRVSGFAAATADSMAQSIKEAQAWQSTDANTQDFKVKPNLAKKGTDTHTLCTHALQTRHPNQSADLICHLDRRCAFRSDRRDDVG